MAGKLIDNIKLTHEEVINQLGLQIAALQVENTILKLENQKMKGFISDLDKDSLDN